MFKVVKIFLTYKLRFALNLYDVRNRVNRKNLLIASFVSIRGKKKCFLKKKNLLKKT